MFRRIALLISLFCLVACTTSFDRAYVSRELARRAGYPIAPPKGVVIEDGLSDEECVALALWNNPTFQGDLTQLGTARADLLEASLLSNPIFQALTPVSPKPLEISVFWALENLWQLPSRIRAAKRDAERTGRSLVQTGLDLARDTRVAHAELLLAEARFVASVRAHGLWKETAELFESRARLGDVSELEAQSVRADVKTAWESETRAQQGVTVARERLRVLLGVDRNVVIRAVPAPIPTKVAATVAQLIDSALIARPDLRAAEVAMDGAAARVGIERARVFALSGIVNIKPVSVGGPLITGPGVSITAPLFNQNQGGIGRAKTDVERMTWRYVALQQRVVLEVQEAYSQLVQAREALFVWRTDVLPGREATLKFARANYGAGAEPYLIVVDATRRLFEAYVRSAELEADARRAAAQLERSLGGKSDDLR